jgi:hypothetical protein
VAGVQQPQLHELVGLDVVDHLHARVLVRRPAVGEGILEHPLGERLADDGPAVLDAEPLATSSRSASVVCGVMRSTIELGNGTSRAIQSASSASRSRANAVRAAFVRWPLPCRLSQDMTVNAPRRATGAGAAPP